MACATWLPASCFGWMLGKSPASRPWPWCYVVRLFGGSPSRVLGRGLKSSYFDSVYIVYQISERMSNENFLMFFQGFLVGHPATLIGSRP